MTERQWRWLLASISVCLVALPLLCVTYPPSIDLPQNVAQVRLFWEALQHPEGLYRIQWLTPYSLATVLLGLIWPLVGPLATGRVGLVIIGAVSTAAIHWLAARRRRPAEAAVLASLTYFGFSLYFGFVSFMVAWPAFLVWIELTGRERDRFDRRHALALCGCGLLLYFSHALWFAVAMLWLGISWVVRRPSIRVVAAQVAALAPILIGAAVWWLSLPHDVNQDWSMFWKPSLLQKLAPSRLAEEVLGRMVGSTNIVVLGVMAAWCVIAVWQARRELRDSIDGYLLLSAGVLGALVLFLPNQIRFTVFLNVRFASGAAALALLAVPPLQWKPLYSRGAALGVALAFCGSVAMTWMLFEREALDGFTSAIESVPPGTRLLGLYFGFTSQYVRGNVCMQEVAYAQVLKGGTLGFSFAEAPSALVVFKDTAAFLKWSPNLEWEPEHATLADVSHFDYVLMGAPPEAQATRARDLHLMPVTVPALWRLYRAPVGE